MTLNSSAGATGSASARQPTKHQTTSMTSPAVCGNSGSARDSDEAVPKSTERHPTLPAAVTRVPEELLRSFSHTKRVGNYLLGRTIGEGSFAKVKEALHVVTGELVAVKVIDKKKAREDPYVRRNMRRESRLLQQIRHRNVVQLFEVMETENSYYLVMEYCAGGDLLERIYARRRLDEVETRRYIRQIVSAVDYMHRAGIIHRDLKVENLLLDESKDIKIIDFGLSNSIRSDFSLNNGSTQSSTKNGMTTGDELPQGSVPPELCVTQCGSPAYAAPELLNNDKYGPRVDIWSIGVNMFAMLTGNLPFTVEPFTIRALYNKMVNGEMNPLPDHLTKPCRDLLFRFLTPNPERRITLQQAMNHTWLTNRNQKPNEPAPFPNRLRPLDLSQSVLIYMTQRLGFRLADVIRNVTTNIPSSSTATYFLLQRRLNRYRRQLALNHRASNDDLLPLFRRDAPLNGSSQVNRSTEEQNSTSTVATAAVTALIRVPSTVIELDQVNNDDSAGGESGTADLDDDIEDDDDDDENNHDNNVGRRKPTTAAATTTTTTRRITLTAAAASGNNLFVSVDNNNTDVATPPKIVFDDITDALVDVINVTDVIDDKNMIRDDCEVREDDGAVHLQPLVGFSAAVNKPPRVDSMDVTKMSAEELPPSEVEALDGFVDNGDSDKDLFIYPFPLLHRNGDESQVDGIQRAAVIVEEPEVLAPPPQQHIIRQHQQQTSRDSSSVTTTFTTTAAGRRNVYRTSQWRRHGTTTAAAAAGALRTAALQSSGTRVKSYNMTSSASPAAAVCNGGHKSHQLLTGRQTAAAAASAALEQRRAPAVVKPVDLPVLSLAQNHPYRNADARDNGEIGYDEEVSADRRVPHTGAAANSHHKALEHRNVDQQSTAAAAMARGTMDTSTSGRATVMLRSQRHWPLTPRRQQTTYQLPSSRQPLFAFSDNENDGVVVTGNDVIAGMSTITARRSRTAAGANDADGDIQMTALGHHQAQSQAEQQKRSDVNYTTSPVETCNIVDLKFSGGSRDVGQVQGQGHGRHAPGSFRSGHLSTMRSFELPASTGGNGFKLFPPLSERKS